MTETDEYLCPGGERLVRHSTGTEDGWTLHGYWNTAACKRCSIKPLYTPAKKRWIKRWEHEAVLDAMQLRLDQSPDIMAVRRETVEHPFGTIKAWMGATQPNPGAGSAPR